MAAPPQPKDDAAHVREKILQLLEQSALHRDQIDWPAARQKLQQATSPADADQLVVQLISRSTANHGRWIRASALSSASGGMQLAAKADQLRRSSGETRGRAQQREPADPKDPIGWISVPAFLDKHEAPRAIRDQQRLTFARLLQWQLRSEDQRNLCGWIVDLRQNGGGNMWPMLVGIAPLLSTDSKHREVIGAFVGGPERQVWSIESGRVLLDDHAPVQLDTPSYVLRHPAPPIAVLLGPKTASSGEAVALAFRGRPATRSFGQRTAGYSTANVPTPLPDGSVLLLTGSTSVDRNLKGDGGRLEPDVSINDAATTEAAARGWLMEQSVCLVGTARAP